MTTLDKKYRTELITALRIHEVSGVRVGEVVAEVEAHVEDTGEDPVDAFGPPREYARRVAAEIEPGKGKLSTAAKIRNGLLSAGLAAVGVDLLMDGLRPMGDSVVYTPLDLVKLAILLTFAILAVQCLFLGYTSGTRRGLFTGLGVASFVAMFACLATASLVVDRETVLLELAPAHSAIAGAVVLGAVVVLLGTVILRNRVVDPR